MTPPRTYTRDEIIQVLARQFTAMNVYWGKPARLYANDVNTIHRVIAALVKEEESQTAPEGDK